MSSRTNAIQIPAGGMTAAATCDAAAWVAELERIQSRQPSGEGMTTSEIASAWGVSTRTALPRLKQLKADGRLRLAKKYVESLRGHLTPVSAYVLLPKGGRK